MNLTSTPPLLLPISDDNKNHILNNQMGRVAECQILPLLRKFRYPKLMCITQCWVLPHICHSQLPWQLYKRQRPNREISGQFWSAKFKNLTLPPVPPELTPAHQLNTSILFSFHSSMAEILQLNLWPLLPESDQGVCINFTSILFSFSFTMGEIWQPLAASAQIWPISLHLFNTSIIFSFNSTMDEIWHLWLLLPKSDQCLLCCNSALLCSSATSTWRVMKCKFKVDSVGKASSCCFLHPTDIWWWRMNCQHQIVY